MPAAQDEESPGSDYFNDLNQQPGKSTAAAGDRESPGEEGTNGQVAKPKRIACVLCRKRKLRCDGGKPSCATCTRLQHECSYDEVRRKSGPKRGYVKALEARLAQVETQLNKEKVPDGPPQRSQTDRSATIAEGMMPEYDIGVGASMRDVLPHMQQTINRNDGPPQAEYPHTALNNSSTAPNEEAFPWEMIGLGLDEPLPTQDIVNELNQYYFDKVHASLPVIHRPRYYAAMNLAPHQRPPVCLRYAMWANAAAVSDRYEGLSEHFYQRARKYIQQDEMRGHGESMITVAHCQTWALLAAFEFKCMYFPRAWMSSGRSSRMALMMGLHRLDGTGLDVKQCLPPPKDWTEREERRRTFWASFCVDRYSSIGTGWPMTIDESDIMSHLPLDESAYELSRGGGKSMQLKEALEPSGTPHLSSFGGVILMACLFGRNLLHLHRPSPDDHDDDLNGEFWKRHRMMDNIVLNTALALPDALRLPQGLNDTNVIFMNMNIHTSTICLHQAAIFKADKNRMPARISAESKVRCITAAAEIASIMRQISHLDLCTMNPFISFCLYVAARVFVQYLKSRPKDAQIRASLQFLLSAMHAIKRKNPLTESFLVQLDVDLEGAGLENTSALRAAMPTQKTRFGSQQVGCPTSMEGGENSRPPAYGDNGLGKYNDPSTTISMATDAPDNNNIAAATTRLGLNREENPTTSGFVYGRQFDLQNRQQRSPASQQSPGMQPSPRIFNPDMDTSPDGSGGADRPTPNSSTHSQHNMSSHTSNSAYSPQNLQQPDINASAQQPSISGMYTQDDLNAFNTDLDMHNFNVPNPSVGALEDFVWNPDMGSVPTGFTPGPTGFTPGPTGGTGFTPGASGMGDFINQFSEADWNDMMQSMSWETDVEHDPARESVMHDRLAKSGLLPREGAWPR